jgi:general L-amino acid transport system substrate-binding protein
MMSAILTHRLFAAHILTAFRGVAVAGIDMRLVTRNILFIAVVLGFAVPWAGAATLDEVRDRGSVRCGVSDDRAGFGWRDGNGRWSGFHIDYCRAVAAAIFGDAAAVDFRALSDKERFAALRQAEIDILSRNTGLTMSRDTTLGLAFPVVSYFDGQGFLVRGEMGLTSVKELSGTPICVQAGSRAELDMARFFASHTMAYNPIVFERSEEAIAAYESARCGAFTDDESRIHIIRQALNEPSEHAVLPEIISRNPVGPVVRKGDHLWFDLVRWVHFALVRAEELGVTSQNIDALADSQDDEIRAFLGAAGPGGEDLGIAVGWTADIVSATGNYGEIFERNLGMESPIQMPRGHNGLWRDGGLHYAPPVR